MAPALRIPGAAAAAMGNVPDAVARAVSVDPERRAAPQQLPPPVASPGAPVTPLVPVDSERARLHAEIAAAKLRVLVARQTIESRQAAAREVLRRQLGAARQVITALERDHAVAAAEIARKAALEVERIRSASDGIGSVERT